VLTDQSASGNVNVQFARNVNVNANVENEMERFREINFRKVRYQFNVNVNTSRRAGIGINYNFGDQVRYLESPFLGSGTNFRVFSNLRPFARLNSQVSINASQFVDTRTDTEVFDVKIYRLQTTYQFTDRLSVRNISEYDDFRKTMALNLLVTYRVNGGTVFYVGYDDHYRQGDRINSAIFPAQEWQRTNRAIFAKFQYLFRY
jgi:hypothetical protein